MIYFNSIQIELLHVERLGLLIYITIVLNIWNLKICIITYWFIIVIVYILIIIW